MQVAHYLESKDIAYRKLDHTPTSSARELARIIHMPGDMVCKSVVVFADRLPVLLVLPANRRIDFSALAQILGSDNLRLADEIEFCFLFPDCELGALPPFGSQYDIRTLLDASLATRVEMICEGNYHDEAFRISVPDYLASEQPEIASFSRY